MHEADEKWDEQSSKLWQSPDRFPTDRPWPSDSRAKIKQKGHVPTRRWNAGKGERLATIFNSQKVSVEEMGFQNDFLSQQVSEDQDLRGHEPRHLLLEMKTLQASDSRGSATRCPEK